MGLDVTGRYRYPPPNPAWLAQHVEEVLDPHIPIIDAHHHLWEEAGARYLLEEIRGDVDDGHAIAATVFVQAHYGYRKDGPTQLAPVGETEKVMTMSREAERQGCLTQIAAGIVGFADLTLGDSVQDVLDAHREVAGDAFKGIRHSVSRDENFPDGIVLRPAPARLLADPAYRAGLVQVAKQGLVFDAMLYHQQIPELTQMARAFPDLSIVLDHLGCILGVGLYEDCKDEVFVAWRSAMIDLANCPNVTVKIGGFGMIVCGANWHQRPCPPTSIQLAEAWRPYIETCIELFGPTRCMFESNFPVDKAMYSYRTLWNAFKRVTDGFSADERGALFAGTAQRIYGLDPMLTQVRQSATASA